MIPTFPSNRNDVFLVCIAHDVVSPDRDDTDVFEVREPVIILTTEELARQHAQGLAKDHPFLKEMDGRIVIIRFTLNLSEQQEIATFDTDGNEV